MTHFYWNVEKNERLIQERQVSFEEIVLAIQEGRILDNVDHPHTRYKGQKMFVVEWNGYAYLVPYVEDQGAVFLKTVIPSRKATKKYLKKEDPA